jgi:hypothetical protein
MKRINESEFYEDRGSFDEIAGLDVDAEDNQVPPAGGKFRLFDLWPKTPAQPTENGRWLEVSPGRHIVADVERRDCPGIDDSKPLAPLAKRRWHVADLCADEERDLIVRAQAGDEAAKSKLHISFHKLILKLVSQRRELLKEAGTSPQEMEAAGLDFAELIAVGHLAFIEAVQRFDVTSGNRLASYVRACIRGQLLNWVKAAARAGICGDMPDGTWIKLSEYSELSVDHSGEDEDRQSTIPHKDADAWSAAGQVGRFGIEWQHIVGIELRILDGIGVRVSRSDPPWFALERLAEAQDRHLARFVALVGRRRAAQVMVERERQRIARRSEESQYLYPGVNARKVRAALAQAERLAPTQQRQAKLAILFGAHFAIPSDFHEARRAEAEAKKVQREIVEAEKKSAAESRDRNETLWKRRQRLDGRKQRRLKEMAAQSSNQTETATDVERISKVADAIERTITLQPMFQEPPPADASTLAGRTKGHEFESSRSVPSH